MRFLLDESAEYRIAALLRDRGHDVTSIVRDHPSALSDEDVLAIARAEDRVLLTNDTDFGELVVRRGHQHRGLVLFRLPAGAVNAKIAAIDRLLEARPHDLREFVVIDRRGARVRRSVSRRPDS